MSGVITCLLENEMGLIPFLDGKSLMIGYLGAVNLESVLLSQPPAEPEELHPNVIRLDFGVRPKSNATPATLLEFRQLISTSAEPRWLEPAPALELVQNILSNLLHGLTKVVIPPNYETAIEKNDLKNGVIRDLEELTKILQSAARAGTRVALLFDY